MGKQLDLLIVEKILKEAMDSTDLLHGGEYQPEQVRELIRLLLRPDELLRLVTFVKLRRQKIEFNKMHMGEPITELAAELTEALPVAGQPRWNKAELDVVKVRSAWRESYELLLHMLAEVDDPNIEAAQRIIMEAMSWQMGLDFAHVALLGDSTITGTDPTSKLLKIMDGWLKQLDAGIVYDAGGVYPQHDLWNVLKRRMPPEFRGDPGLRWMVSDTVADDWLAHLAERGTALGDAAISGQGASPLGIPLQRINKMPDDLGIDSGSDPTPGRVNGTRYGPFHIITGSNDTLELNDGAGAFTVVFPAGVHDTVDMVKTLNDYFTANTKNVFADFWRGGFSLETTATGIGASVEVTANGNAQAALGLAVGTYAGKDANGMLYEGGIILLCNPKTLYFGQLVSTGAGTAGDGLRSTTEYNKDFDRVETATYAHIDCTVANKGQVVKCINVRRRPIVLVTP